MAGWQYYDRTNNEYQCRESPTSHHCQTRRCEYASINIPHYSAPREHLKINLTQPDVVKNTPHPSFPTKIIPFSRDLRCTTPHVGRSHKMDVSYGSHFTGIPEHTRYRICHANSSTSWRSSDGYQFHTTMAPIGIEMGVIRRDIDLMGTIPIPKIS